MANPAVPGVRVVSPSYGPSDTLPAVSGAIDQVHRRVAPYLLVRRGMATTAPPRLAPPVPYDAGLIDQGVQDAEGDLQTLVPLPEQLFSLSTKYVAMFRVVDTSPDYNDAGRQRQRDATAAQLAAGIATLTDRLVATFAKVAEGWIGQARDPGRTLLLGKGVPPDVTQLAMSCALAPVAFVIALLEQLTPQASDDPGDQLRRENVAAVLWLRKPEWSVNPRVAEQALAAFRRAQAKDRGSDFFGGIYVEERLDAMSRAWSAAVSFALQHGYLDAALRLPLTEVFARPDAAAARAIVLAGLPQDDADVLQAFGLKLADPSGLEPRSSESAGPIVLTDTGSRGT